MNNEVYVTYEQAKQLKRLGFNWPNYQFYGTELNPDGSLYWDELLPYPQDSNTVLRRLSATSLDMTAKWLRDVHGMFVDVWLCAAGWSWNIEKCSTPKNMGTHITKHDEESGDDVDSGLFTTYEKALSSAIDKALEMLIQNYQV